MTKRPKSNVDDLHLPSDEFDSMMRQALKAQPRQKTEIVASIKKPRTQTKKLKK